MGCGASRNDVIKSSKSSSDPESTENPKLAPVLNNSSEYNSESLNSTSSVRSESSTIPANDFYQNNLKGEGENLKSLDQSVQPLKPPRATIPGSIENKGMDKPSRPDPIAFEVPAEDEKDETESLIKRHPPRRLRMAIEETDTTPSLTQEILSEKVQMANERRNQALHQRVASARQKSARVSNRVRDTNFTENENQNEEQRS